MQSSGAYPAIHRDAAIAGTVMVAAMLLGAATTGAGSDPSNVTVDVDRMTAVTVEPDQYTFSQMELGTANFSDVPAHQLIITNDGSTNISNVYASLNTLESEPDNPLGSGDAQAYAAGRFFWIKNATSGFHHAGSLAWNETEKPSGINEPENDESYPPSQSWGFYRNATGNYLWGLAGNATWDDTLGLAGEWDTSGSVCNKTDTSGDSSEYPPELRVKNETDTGDNRDLTNNTVTYEFTDGSPGNPWGVARAEDGPLAGHYLAAHHTCEKVYIYRFDARSTFPLSGQPDQYLVGPDATLVPGETYTGRVGAAVPDGIPSGATNETTLTVYATAE